MTLNGIAAPLIRRTAASAASLPVSLKTSCSPACIDSLRMSGASSSRRRTTTSLTAAGSTSRRWLSGSSNAAAPEAAVASSSSPVPPPITSTSTTAAAAAASSSTSTANTVTSTAQALALLRKQPRHYVIASLVGRTFLLSLSDILTVPRLKDVRVGDVLELDRVHEVGSQDYTLRAQDPIAPRVRKQHYAQTGLDPLEGASSTTKWTSRLIPAGLAFTGAALKPETVRVRCVVVEHTKGKMEYIVKEKRRKGYKKTIKHKQPYTRIRVEEIKLGVA